VAAGLITQGVMPGRIRIKNYYVSSIWNIEKTQKKTSPAGEAFSDGYYKKL
jgi:hypothetical protein